MQELFFNNKPLSDDRSVAYYNLQENTVIETCSNPLWVAILYAIVVHFASCEELISKNKRIAEEGEREGVIMGVRKIIGELFNSKNQRSNQLPPFESIEVQK